MRSERPVKKRSILRQGSAHTEISHSDLADEQPGAGSQRDPVDARHGDVLAGGAGLHRMALGLQRLDDLT